MTTSKKPPADTPQWIQTLNTRRYHAVLGEREGAYVTYCGAEFAIFGQVLTAEPRVKCALCLHRTENINHLPAALKDIRDRVVKRAKGATA